MSFKLKPFLIAVILSSVALGSNFVAFGDEPTTPATPPVKCSTLILESLEQSKNNLYTQITTIIQSTTPASAYFGDLQELYLETVNGISTLRTDALYDKDAQVLAKLTQITREHQNSECDPIIDAALTEIQSVYQRSIQKNLKQKSSLMLVEKLDQMNTKLGDLVTLIHRVSAQVQKFDKSFTCHIPNCTR